MARVMVIEGMTASGKSTKLSDISSVLNIYCMRETPIVPSESVGVSHQEAVFNHYMRDFAHAFKLGRVVWCDFSPLGCIPFSIALSHFTKDATLAPHIEQMRTACDAMVRKHVVILHRYLHVSPTDAWRRLRTRGREGDDTWSYDFLKLLSGAYDDFFQRRLSISSQDRITSVAPVSDLIYNG